MRRKGRRRERGYFGWNYRHARRGQSRAESGHRVSRAARRKLDVKDFQGKTPANYAEGVRLSGPPEAKPQTVALLLKLTTP